MFDATAKFEIQIDPKRIAQQVAIYYEDIKDGVEEWVRQAIDSFDIVTFVKAIAEKHIKEGIEYQIKRQIDSDLHWKINEPIATAVQIATNELIEKFKLPTQ